MHALLFIIIASLLGIVATYILKKIFPHLKRTKHIEDDLAVPTIIAIIILTEVIIWFMGY